MLWPQSKRHASRSTRNRLAGTYLDSGVGSTSLVWDSLSIADALRLAIRAALSTALSVENPSSFQRCVISRICFLT